MDLFSDQRCLVGISRYERQLAKLLGVLLALVIGIATFQLLLTTGFDLIRFQLKWFEGGLMQFLDRLLLILIALEVLQNVTAYWRDHSVQIELVMLTALTAVARKVIVLPPGADDKPLMLAGFGIIVVGLSIAYWFVVIARRAATPAPFTPPQP